VESRKCAKLDGINGKLKVKSADKATRSGIPTTKEVGMKSAIVIPTERGGTTSDEESQIVIYLKILY